MSSKEYKNIAELSFRLNITVKTDWSEEGLKGFFRSGTVLHEHLMNTLYNFFVLSPNEVSEIGVEFLNDDYDLKK